MRNAVRSSFELGQVSVSPVQQRMGGHLSHEPTTSSAQFFDVMLHRRFPADAPAVATRAVVLNRPLADGGAEGTTAASLRAAVGKQLRAGRAEFEPFAELEPLREKAGAGGAAYAAYCERVVSTHEWGGQLELQALTQILKAPITVHEAGKEPVLMGAGGEGGGGGGAAALQLSYHRHAYSLGEHYNSVVSQ